MLYLTRMPDEVQYITKMLDDVEYLIMTHGADFTNLLHCFRKFITD